MRNKVDLNEWNRMRDIIYKIFKFDKNQFTNWNGKKVIKEKWRRHCTIDWYEEYVPNLRDNALYSFWKFSHVSYDVYEIERKEI